MSPRRAWSLHGQIKQFCEETGWRFGFTYDPDEEQWISVFFDATESPRCKTQHEFWWSSASAGLKLARRVHADRWKQMDEMRPS